MNRRNHSIFFTGCFLAAALSCSAEEALTIDNSDAQFSSANNLKVTCLKYHGLSPDCGDPAFRPDVFDKQMKWLRDNNFESVDLPQLVGWMREGTPALPTRPVLLVADDNYMSIYTVAFPTLKKYGFTGVNCAHSRYVGVKTQWPHPTWEQLNEMERDGTIITESHSATHPNLNQCDDAKLHDEIYGSKADFEKNMPGKRVFCFAYPMAVIDDRATAAVRMAGYGCAMCGRDGLIDRDTDPYLMTRFLVDPRTTCTMKMFEGYATAGLGSGPWKTADAEDAVGDNCAMAPAGDGTANACWQWTPDATRPYAIDVRIPRCATPAATNAIYTIRHRDGISTVSVNQRTNSGKWLTLGTFPLAKGRPAYVAVNNKADATVLADAIRISPSPKKKE
ncbi:polysaccharide deacetylase family protein [Candidatus Sumerlaeota bacterium]|nr:polysaccharide deacetylase family protein [Candidatus Sumerlaeota bacterium]